STSRTRRDAAWSAPSGSATRARHTASARANRAGRNRSTRACVARAGARDDGQERFRAGGGSVEPAPEPAAQRGIAGRTGIVRCRARAPGGRPAGAGRIRALSEALSNRSGRRSRARRTGQARRGGTAGATGACSAADDDVLRLVFAVLLRGTLADFEPH